MTVGDVTSAERGSGARFNTGKVPLEYIPAEILGMWVDRSRDTEFEPAMIDADWVESFLDALGQWQRREIGAWHLLAYFDRAELFEAARVFEYGTKKYAAWNWAKGMKWSVCVGCIQRHLMEIVDGQLVDAESGRLHIGHVLCNVIMLVHYSAFYREGDDRPPVEIFRAE